MTLYCTNCGKKHDYTLEKPRFCSDCGTQFAGGEAKASVPVKKIAPSREVHVEASGEEEDSEKEVPHIDKILVEIETDRPPVMKFGSAKQSMSFAREKPAGPLTIDDLNARTEKLFERDRQETKENK